MRKVICVMVAMLFLLTACGSSETSSEKENTKTEGVEDSNVDSMKNTSNTDSDAAVEKNNENTNEKEEKPVNVSIEKEAATPVAPVNETLKEKYLKILNDTKVRADNIVPVDYTTPSLNQAEGERYELWDRLLNELYGVLKSQLSVKEMDQLRVKQREWIIYIDNKAKEASLVNEGGSAEQLVYLGELANQTEIRCYTLVNDYMK